MGHIRLDKLRVGDVIGTTDASMPAVITRVRTWGWKQQWDLGLSTHTAVIVDRGEGLLYACEMGPEGLRMGELHQYDNGPRSWFGHICWVGRHQAFDDWALRDRACSYMKEQHAFGVKYGFSELFQYLFPKLPNEYPYKLICSQWANLVFKHCEVLTPFGEQVSPADWQRWSALKNITQEVIA